MRSDHLVVALEKMAEDPRTSDDACVALRDSAKLLRAYGDMFGRRETARYNDRRADSLDAQIRQLEGIEEGE